MPNHGHAILAGHPATCSLPIGGEGFSRGIRVFCRLLKTKVVQVSDVGGAFPDFDILNFLQAILGPRIEAGKGRAFFRQGTGCFPGWICWGIGRFSSADFHRQISRGGGGRPGRLPAALQIRVQLDICSVMNRRVSPVRLDGFCPISNRCHESQLSQLQQ